MELKEKQIGKFIILSKELGKGAYAVCKKGCMSDNESIFVAVKIIDKNKLQMQNDKEKINRELEHIKREISHLKVLDSDHIVKMYDIAQTPNNLYLFLEYCNGGSLDNYLSKQNNQLSEQEALLIFGEICQGFKSMQKNKIIHRDIKPQNILIHNSKIKIADFGFSKMVDDINVPVLQTFLGTPLYLPIEILMGEKYSSKCDVFSVGIILYEMLYGVHPFFHQIQISGIVSLIQKLKLSALKFPENPKINPYVKNLLEKMLGIYEINRISWDEIFVDPYFLQIEDQEKQQKDLIKNVLNLQQKENDNFKKIMIQQDTYLNDNLVCGMITKLDKQPEQEQIPKGENQKQDQYLEEVSQMHEQVLFERNIAIFYFNLLRKFWKSQKKILQIINESLFYRLLYTLSKMGLLFLNKLTMYLNNQMENIQKTQDQAVLSSFQNTIQFKQDLNLLQNDQTTYMKLQFELYQKTLDIINNQLEIDPENQEIIQFQQIFKENIDKKILKNIFDSTCNKILDLFMNNLLEQDQQILIIIRYLQIIKNPYNSFQFKKDEGFNFHKFYDYLEKKEKQSLIDDIQCS